MKFKILEYKITDDRDDVSSIHLTTLWLKLKMNGELENLIIEYGGNEKLQDQFFNFGYQNNFGLSR